MSGSIAPRIL